MYFVIANPSFFQIGVIARSGSDAAIFNILDLPAGKAGIASLHPLVGGFRSQ